jgi:spermidine synthase
VYEIKLGDAYLMSSLFHVAESELATRGLGELAGQDWDVVVGGLGLGYTAAAALAFPQVKQLIVVEALAPVIDWHRRALVPTGRTLSTDPRCSFHQGDFFALARGKGFDPEVDYKRFDAILLDIDHAPDNLLSPAHADFYTEEGLQRLARFVKPGGLFGLWSNDPPDDAFLGKLTRAFGHAEGHLVQFDNPLQNSVSSSGLYLARNGAT